MKVAGAPSESVPTYLNVNESKKKVAVAPSESVPTYLNVNESKWQ